MSELDPSPNELAAAVATARRLGWKQDDITLAGWIAHLAALSASGAGEDRSSETLDEWYADLVVAIPAALGMTPDPWPNTPAQIEALVREIRRAYPRVPPQEPT